MQFRWVGSASDYDAKTCAIKHMFLRAQALSLTGCLKLTGKNMDYSINQLYDAVDFGSVAAMKLVMI